MSFLLIRGLFGSGLGGVGKGAFLSDEEKFKAESSFNIGDVYQKHLKV